MTEAISIIGLVICASCLWGIFVNGFRATFLPARFATLPVRTWRFWLYGLLMYVGWVFLNLAWFSYQVR
jgi:hypothetical protein